MNTINSTSNSYNLYTQNNTQVSNSQDHHKAHHHKKIQPQDSSKFSQETLKALQGTSTTEHKNPLDDLVTNGTITQDQENSIKSAFQSARQANMAGTYGSKPTNPISNLVTNGTITEDQANAIKDAFKSAQKAQQTPNSKGHFGVHHHHHHVQQSQDVPKNTETTSQPTNILTESQSSSL